LKSKLERKLRIALNRFNSSTERDTAEDELIDLVICLEAIFSEGPGDLRWKVSTRCARLLGSTKKKNKLQLQKFIKDMYDLRSKTVHGGKNAIKIDELIELNEIARQSIKKWLRLLENVNSDDICKLFDFGVNEQTYKLINNSTTKLNSKKNQSHK